MNGFFVEYAGVSDRIERIMKRSIKKETKIEFLKKIISLIDLTTLDGNDTPERIKKICQKAKKIHFVYEYPHVAAVCVYPSLVSVAKEELEDSPIKVASVVTYFPSGQAPLSVKINDIKMAIDEGADEIDMVINRNAFLSGKYEEIENEIKMALELCPKNVKLKAILEVGELETLDKVRKAADIALKAGAHFIKTSTGKIQPAASLHSVFVMCCAIKDFLQKTKEKRGIKPAGGISSAKSAIQYFLLVKETLGDEWLSPDYFRIGASKLLNDILMQLEKEKTGIYQAPEYFSLG